MPCDGYEHKQLVELIHPIKFTLNVFLSNPNKLLPLISRHPILAILLPHLDSALLTEILIKANIKDIGIPISGYPLKAGHA